MLIMNARPDYTEFYISAKGLALFQALLVDNKKILPEAGSMIQS